MVSIACAICGGDPVADTMLVNAAVAGALGMQWFFRDRIAAMARRMRGKPQDDEETCQVRTDEDD